MSEKTVTTPWDAADYLETLEDVAYFLEAAFEDGDPDHIVRALGTVARSKGMTEISRLTGLGRQSLYKALSGSSSPEFATICKIMGALGLVLTVRPREARHEVA